MCVANNEHRKICKSLDLCNNCWYKGAVDKDEEQLTLGGFDEKTCSSKVMHQNMFKLWMRDLPIVDDKQVDVLNLDAYYQEQSSSRKKAQNEDEMKDEFERLPLLIELKQLKIPKHFFFIYVKKAHHWRKFLLQQQVLDYA